MSKRSIVREYMKVKTQAKVRGVGETMVNQLLRRVTSGQQRMKHSIDYCVGVLLLENVRKMEDLVKLCVPEGSKKKDLQKQAVAVCNYLKNEYETHLDCDGDAAHDTRRALVGCADEVLTGKDGEAFNKKMS